MDQPIFYTKNIARYDANVMTASTGSAGLPFLVDCSSLAQWQSVGSNDATPEIIIIDFGVSQYIGAIFLDNINLKDFKVQYWDGSAWQDITETINTAYALPYFYAEFTHVLTQEIQLIMNTTQSADDQKRIGELYLCDKVLPLDATAEFNYKEDSVLIGGSYRLGNGKLQSWFVNQKWLGNITFNYLQASILASLKAIYDTHDSFCIRPEPEAAPQDFFEAKWTGKWTAPYSGEIKANGKDLTMTLEEV